MTLEQAQTRQAGPRGLGDRARLHGHEPVLWSGGRRGVDRDAASRHRSRLHVFRHGRGLWAVRQRGADRPRADRPARQRDHRHQIRLQDRERPARSAPNATAGPSRSARRSRGRSAASRPIASIFSTSTASIPRFRSRTSPARSAISSARARRATSACRRPASPTSAAPTPYIRSRRCKASIRCGSAIWRRT